MSGTASSSRPMPARGSAWCRSPGLVARRIVCWKREGDRVGQGERFGMIRFGSRLDVYLPEGSVVAVGARQRAVSGETVLAYLPGADPTPPFATRPD